LLLLHPHLPLLVPSSLLLALVLSTSLLLHLLTSFLRLSC